MIDVLDSVDAPGVARRALRDLADAGATDPTTGLWTWKGLQQRLERGRTDAPVCGAVILVDAPGDVTRALRRLGEEVRGRLPRGSEVARLDAQELVLVVPGHAAGLVDPVGLVADLSVELAGELGVAPEAVSCCPLAPTTTGGLLGRVRRVQTQLLVSAAAPSPFLPAPAIPPEEVHAGLERGEFELVYQPVLGPDGAVVAVEALVRWARPSGIVLPSDFLPGLERAGLDLPLGEWVLSRALADASRWGGGPLGRLPVVVNVSPTQLAAPGLAAAVEEGLGRSGAAGLVLETAPRPEDVDLRGLLGVLGELRDAGARLSLDRVDRSAISAGLLSALPLVDTVKLDRSVVADLHGTGRATAAALRILAERVGTSLGATGVETAAQLDSLRSLGVEVVQGYRFCPPVAVGDLAARVRRLDAAPAAATGLQAFTPPTADEVDAIVSA